MRAKQGKSAKCTENGQSRLEQEGFGNPSYKNRLIWSVAFCLVCAFVCPCLRFAPFDGFSCKGGENVMCDVALARI